MAYTAAVLVGRAVTVSIEPMSQARALNPRKRHHVTDATRPETKISDIYELLESWRRQQDRDKTLVLELTRKNEELERQRGRAVATIEQAFSLQHREGMTFQQIVDAIVQQISFREGEDKARIESLEDEVGRLGVHIKGLESERQGAIDNLVWSLELPPHRSRELANAVGEAIALVVEAKQILQENA